MGALKQNSLSQNLTVLPAPSGREPLARPAALRFSREVCRYAKGPISEGAVIERKRNDWGSLTIYFLKYPPSCGLYHSSAHRGYQGLRRGGQAARAAGVLECGQR